MDSDRLTEMHCETCVPGTPPLTGVEIEGLLPKVPNWSVHNGVLRREFKEGDFQGTLDLLNRIAGLAEHENHHPDLYLHGWNHLRVDLFTHSIGGLSRNDFILAARIDQLVDVATAR